MATVTRALTHIRLLAPNANKLATLDALAAEYMGLCRQYVTAFCTDKMPDKFAAAIFPSPLSARWQRVTIQQAAGIAQSWRTNRERAHTAYQDELAEYIAQPAEHLPAVLPAGCQVRVRFAAGRPLLPIPMALPLATATSRSGPNRRCRA